MQVAEYYIEMSMRLLMGQDWMFSDEVASQNFDLSPDNPQQREIFDKYIARRDHVREVMKAVYNIAFEPHGYLIQRSTDSLEAVTIWEAIRHARKTTEWSMPFQMGQEPVPKIEVIEENETNG